jgi:hypothetical protein
MKSAARARTTLFSVLGFAAWCITALVINEGILAADIIAVAVAGLLTFLAVVSWRESHSS